MRFYIWCYYNATNITFKDDAFVVFNNLINFWNETWSLVWVGNFTCPNIEFVWCVFHGGTKLVWLHIDNLQILQMDPFSPTLHGNNIWKLWRYNVLRQHLSFLVSYIINSHIVNSWWPWELSIDIIRWIVMQNQTSSII